METVAFVTVVYTSGYSLIFVLELLEFSRVMSV